MLPARSKKFTNVAPVHAHIMDGIVGAKLRHIAETVAEERHILGLAHLAGSHRKLAVMNRAIPRRVPFDLDVKRRIRERSCGSPTPQKCAEWPVMERVAAINAIFTELPCVPQICHWRTLDVSFRDVIFGIIVLYRFQDRVDLGNFEASDSD